MHYYQHHIGDFIKATARLSDSQTMGYLRLIWMYYDRERPLNPDTKLLAFQIGSSVEDTQLLLDSFFILTEAGWFHTRCDQEIQEYREHQNKKSRAGKASAERRLNRRSTDVEQVLNNSNTSDEQVLNNDATGVQLTSNHKPVTKREVPNGTRLQVSELDPEWEKFCRDTRPDLNPKAVFESFCDFWKSAPGTKGVKLDWFLVWKNWVRRETAIPALKAKEQVTFRRAV